MDRPRNVYSTAPPVTTPTTSWWLGKSRAELQQAAREHLNRMRWSKGASWVSGMNFEGAMTGVDRKLRRPGSAL